jgi:DNA-binding winged helix-turn-helix (wHTH) protein/TolB-like protein
LREAKYEALVASSAILSLTDYGRVARQSGGIVGQCVINNMESERFRFGLFEFDTATRELRREGVLVRLQSQPAQVLACLIERASQVVSREELRKVLWGGETFVDFDRGLNFCVSQIRSALRDESIQPTYIRTIPKHGYQFIAPVERVSEREPGGEENVPVRSGVNVRAVVLACAAGIFVVLASTAGYLLWPRQNLMGPPIVAVLRFDNETGQADMVRFSDGLTDSVVEQLTSQSGNRYQVIGNALILRGPRDLRDLNAIATSLHAAYVVLGQVQSNSGQVVILAHLIRLPDQTHIWVVRAERTLGDPLNVESEVAQKIAAEFSSRVPADSTPISSPPLGSH